jgi:hypothetical protein
MAKKTIKKEKGTQVEMTGKCRSCGKKEVLTSKQILEAEETGAALSTCCFFPMTIEKVKLS